jgi:hypothetical protein
MIGASFLLQDQCYRARRKRGISNHCLQALAQSLHFELSENQIDKLDSKTHKEEIRVRTVLSSHAKKQGNSMKLLPWWRTVPAFWLGTPG